MSAIAISDLVDRVRLESGLRNNAYYDTNQILNYLNAGGSELYDIFTATNQHYNISEFDFTTTGPDDAIVTLPDDFQQGHSLDIYPGSNRAFTIRYLSNWLNRNSATGSAAVFSGGRYPVYTFLDNKLRFYPPQLTPAAPFKLYYTPMWTPLALPITVNFMIAAGDTPQVPPPGILAGNGAWLLANAAFNADIPEDGSVDLELTFTTTNLTFSGTYPIVEIGLPSEGYGSPTASCDNLVSTVGYSTPATGNGTYTYQPIGTRGTLPSILASWSEYVVVYAAMAVNIDRQRPIGELERKLNALKARIASILSVRQEEPQQPPLTRNTGGWFGSGSDF